jgi:hypothetical protein
MYKILNLYFFFSSAVFGLFVPGTFKSNKGPLADASKFFMIIRSFMKF